MDIKQLYRNRPALLSLIITNVAVTVTLAVVAFAGTLTVGRIDLAVDFLDLPPSLGVIFKPWTLLTYMFTQSDVWHCVVNMLWLYWFGYIFRQFSSGRRLVQLYVVSGIAGGLLYSAVTLLLEVAHAPLEGASASVLGVVTSTAILAPRYELNLFLFGRVRLLWVALVTIALFTLGISGAGVGTNIAHAGGAGGGALFTLWMRYHRFRLVKGEPGHGYSEADAREELDRLLDKVKRSGYGSLTVAERNRLVELSRKV